MSIEEKVKEAQLKRFDDAGWSAKEAEKLWKLYKREYLGARKEYEEYSLIK